MASSAFFFDAEPVCEPSSSSSSVHLPALDACALCAKRLGRDCDIFMYRGDTPFCSEDCRDEQIQIDAVRARSAGRRRRQQYSSRTESGTGRHQEESRKVSVAAT